MVECKGCKKIGKTFEKVIKKTKKKGKKTTLDSVVKNVIGGKK